MLETLNLLVGLAVVIMLLSFAVTLITQLVVGLFNLRGWALRTKVQNLLVLIDNGIHPRDASHIAGLVLRNALIGKTGLPWLAQPPMRERGDSPQASKQWRSPLGFGFRTAAVIQREELTRLLLSLGKEQREYPDRWHWFGRLPLDTDDLQTKMRVSLIGNGVTDPDAVLARIRQRMLELERFQPELSNSERQTQAILETAQSAFLGKLNGWFDQTVDRASDVFTGWTHFTAFLVALLVAGTLQLDSLALINRLTTEKETRSTLVDWAARHVDETPPTAPATGTMLMPLSARPGGVVRPPAKAPAAGPADAAAAPTKLEQHLSSAAAAALNRNDLIPIPDPAHWVDHWTKPVPCPASLTLAWGAGPTRADAASQPTCTLPPVNWLGVALSTVLLSLGGPFWYSTLSGLLKLRSALASKDDDTRKDRQTNTAAKAA